MLCAMETRIALITGGGRGLGRASAIALAQQGHDLILTYREHSAQAEEVAALVRSLGRKSTVLALDVADIASHGGFAERMTTSLRSIWGRDRFDALVNNAGIDVHSPLGGTTEAQFDALLNVHFKGPYFLTQTLLPLIADGGSIVNTSTGLARFTIPGYGAYAGMKSAMESLSRYWAKELGERRIRVNIIAPGAIETDFTAPAFAHNPGMKDFIASQTALGRVGQPDDIGGVVAFLCSDAAKWVNAQRVEASGGMFL